MGGSIAAQPFAPGISTSQGRVVYWLNHRSWPSVLAMGIVWTGTALLTFYAFNPALWLDPVGRLSESLLFNTSYSTSSAVQKAGWGWAQPAVWLFSSVSWEVREVQGLFPVLLDGVFSLFGLLALGKMWGRPAERLVVLWFAINMFFLFFWPTKWPQYILAVSVPILLMASFWLQERGQGIWRGWLNRPSRSLAARSGWKRTWPWLGPVLFFGGLLVVYPVLLQFVLATTSFETRNLKDGTWGLLKAFGRGLLSLPPRAAGNLPYQEL